MTERDQQREPVEDTSVVRADAAPAQTPETAPLVTSLLRLQNTAGNRAVGRLLRDAGTTAGPDAPPEVAAQVQARAGGGTPLEPGLRVELENGLGAELDGVRLHRDSPAADLAGRIEARAFTAGQDIYFGSGGYAPDSPSGYRLIAHEVAHTVQQPAAAAPDGAMTVSQPEEAGEVAAGAVADQLVKARGLAAPPAAPQPPAAPPAPSATLAPMLRREPSAAAPTVLRRDPTDTAPAPPQPGTEPQPAPAPPQHRNQKVGTWVGWVDSSIVTLTELGGDDIRGYYPGAMVAVPVARAGWTSGRYPSEDAAVAAVRAANTAGVVFVEDAQYVAYHAVARTLVYHFTWDNVQWSADKPWTAVRFEGGPPPLVIVTEDGVALRPEMYRTEDEAKTTVADQALMPGAGDPFAGYRQAFGSGASPGPLDMVFFPAMRDNALSMLSASRAQVERDIERRFSSGLIPRSEVELMRHTASYLAGIDEEMAAIPKDIPPDPDAYARFHALEQRRRVVLARYPMLARVDARSFAQLPEDQQMVQLGEQSMRTRDDIDRTRSNVIDGSLNLWRIPPLVDSTIAGLGVHDPAARQHVQALVAANQSSVGEDILRLFTIVFGLASIVVDGPVGVAVAAGAFGLGVADAIEQTEQFSAEQAAANTALDPTVSLLPPDEARSWGWLVVAWMGVIADAAQVVAAIRAVRAAGGAIEAGVSTLARGDERLATQLRAAAGAGEATEVISEASRAALANRLGTAIEIDEVLGSEVRVVYHVDSRGRAVLDGVRVGPQATVGVIRAHEVVVGLLRRYDGVLGKLREITDRLLSLAGFPPAGANPFPAGTQAFESFLELKKLPEVIESRRAALGLSLGTDSEPALRADVEFLEGEITRHQQFVDQMAADPGVGFVAARANQSFGAEARLGQIRSFAEGARELAERFPGVIRKLVENPRPDGLVNLAALSHEEQAVLAEVFPMVDDLEKLTLRQVQASAGVPGAELNRLYQAEEAAVRELRESTQTLYSKLRVASPSQRMRDMVISRARGIDEVSLLPPPSGSLDVDHMVPLREIVDLPGFTALDWADQVAVVNEPANLRAIDSALNRARADYGWAEAWGRRGEYAVEALQRAEAIEEQARTRLIALIRERLVASGRPLP